VNRPHDNSKAFDAILASLVNTAVHRMASAAMYQAKHLGSTLSPEDTCTLLESISSKIRARMATAEKLQNPEPKV
jgi:hypothetical protein